MTGRLGRQKREEKPAFRINMNKKAAPDTHHPRGSRFLLKNIYLKKARCKATLNTHSHPQVLHSH
jgi:hypothetical protein